MPCAPLPLWKYLDKAVYPDSGKIGIWGKDINRVYRMDENVDYYTGE